MKAERIAGEALRASRDQIASAMRFMDPAVFALKGRVAESGFRTDGTILYYDPADVIRRCRRGLSHLSHDYLHVLMHCIFRHISVKRDVNEANWNLAADIAAEDVILSFGMDTFLTDVASGRKEVLERFRKEVGSITAERVYRYFGEKENELSAAERERLSGLFTVDDHSGWYQRQTQSVFQTDRKDEGESGEDGLITMEESSEDPDGKGKNSKAEPDWDRISQMIQTSIETGGEQYGADPGTMLSALHLRQRKKIDYGDFLRRFALRKETMKVDDSAFDYIFYTYGLELYGDTPLIEPLEYSDEKQVRDFVIVIDTSASTEGELVTSFVEQTFEILQESPEIGRKFNIHVIQCDAAIQDDTVLRTKEDVKWYISGLKIRGFGGTDFRTAFRYVNDLIVQGTLSDLKGLIYFTDGQGIYPKSPPPYDTVFVFADDDSADAAKVPPWAMKAVFNEVQ